MRRVLSSPRLQRRLVWWLALAAVAAAVAGLIVAFPNRSAVDRTRDAGGRRVRVASPEPTSLAPQSPRAQAAALRTARDFLRTAVLRRHVDRSWPLVGPKLRQGLTRREWASGNIPVIPFPARALREARWRVARSTSNELGLEVLLLSKPTAPLRSMTFRLELKAVGTPARRHWLVSGWTPTGGFAPPVPVARSGRIDLLPRSRGHGPLGAAWLLAPLVLVLAVLLVPAAILLRGWLAGRRAARAFRERGDAVEPAA